MEAIVMTAASFAIKSAISDDVPAEEKNAMRYGHSRFLHSSLNKTQTLR
jgi:hypothetical protein